MAGESEDDPHELIRRARAGDRDAMGQLLQMYRHYLQLMAESHLHQQSRHVLSASDAVQETFLKAQMNFHQFRGATERELIAWLRRILANCIVSLARRPLGLRRQRSGRDQQLSELLDDSSQAMAGLFIAPDSSPSSQAARRERAVLFANAVQQLPDHYRQVILLRHLQEMPFADIARQMGRTVDSVEKLWVRALDRLRQLLKEED